jgi:hypothetical protein
VDKSFGSLQSPPPKPDSVDLPTTNAPHCSNRSTRRGAIDKKICSVIQFREYLES